MRSGSHALSYGIYFGATEIHQELPGFSISLLTPTLRAEDVPLHTHANASFVFVVAGSYLTNANDAPPICTTPTLIFNPAGTTHRDSFVLPNGRFLAVSISDESFRIATDGITLLSTATAFTSGDAIATALRLTKQCAGPGIHSFAMMEGLCWELLSNTTVTPLWPKRNLPSWLRNARELLHDQCADSPLMTEMAQQLGVHPVYFARAFRRVFRCTPAEYRMRCRLRKAMDLLRKAQLPLSDIALDVGFFDQSHFTRVFREHFGISPHAYRKRLHGNGQNGKVQFVQERAARLGDTAVRRTFS